MELKLPQLNSVQLIGRLVADPHPLTAKDGTPGVAFVLAANRYVPQTKKTVTVYIDCVAWGETATAILTCCGKGSPVLVVGNLAQHTKSNGKVETKVVQVSIQSAQFLAARPKEDAP